MPDPVWQRDSFTGVYVNGEWWFGEDHDSGIVYGKVQRLRELWPDAIPRKRKTRE